MYGIIDIGSNTIRLVLYDIRNGKIQPMLNKKFTAGLAGYVKKGVMTEKGVKKAIEVLTEFRHILDYIQVKELFCIATASLRNIENSDEVLVAVKEQCGFAIRILSGEEEALYDYYGVMQSIDEPNGLVIDIGGGSTELVFYQEKTISLSLSLAIGSLTAYSAYVHDILPTPKEQKAIAAALEAAMAGITVPKTPDIICGVGGSIRAAVKVYNELFEDTLPAGRIEIAKLASILSIKQNVLAKAILKTAPERIHTFIPGLILLSTISEKWNIQSIIVSQSGVKEGYLAEKLHQERAL